MWVMLSASAVILSSRLIQRVITRYISTTAGMSIMPINDKIAVMISYSDKLCTARRAGSRNPGALADKIRVLHHARFSACREQSLMERLVSEQVDERQQQSDP